MNLLERYFRQIPIIGEEGQVKLKNSKVVIVGVGGLGSVVATYLTMLGVGEITLIDYDKVELSNLNRQFLHTNSDLSKKKVISGYEKLSSLNPDIKINIIDQKITSNTIESMIKKDMLIVEALDNIESRYILFKYAYQKKIPYFHAGVSGFIGQVSTFIHEKDKPCLFCILPNNEKKYYKPPVIGTTVGVIGSIQCNEVLKYITKKGTLLKNKILIWNGLENTIDYISFSKNVHCPVCGKEVIKK